jgi:2-keto-4-pentenoate hydratase/2-oxohepta-3-ene-1,7-dioic acid hydratase in catechol pathway
MLGALVDGSVLELARAAALLDVPESSPALLATMESLLAEWDHGLLVARETAARAETAGSSARERLSAARHSLEHVTLHPPVWRPPSIRDFYAFEAHVRNARARRGLEVPAEWFEFPVFYFTNPGALVGHGGPVRKPAWTAALDYELEIACVIAKEARDVPAEHWRSVVAGFTVMNDWSARDVQRKEMAVGLGPAKGKDFATSLGPALVTLDELEASRVEDRHDLSMEARVNGRTLSRGNAKDLHFTFGQMIARASQDVYLFPGDVIGSGTVGGGCLLELGPEVHRWLQPGDEVTLEIERLGALSNRIL